MRPQNVFVVIGAAMVGWFMVRMWGGGAWPVWRASCLIGAWSPIGAAAIFLYVRATGDREDSVFVAWLVRAIGMHCVLAWLIGVTDALRGPPVGSAPLNADLYAPVAMVAFFPVFGLCVAVMHGLLGVHRRLASESPSTTRTVVIDAGELPYRGAARRVTEVVARSPFGHLVASALGGVAVGFALASRTSPAVTLCASAVAFGLASALGPATVTPSVLSLVLVAGALLVRELSPAMGALQLACAWPWVALAAVALYALTAEARLRLPRGAIAMQR